MPSWRKEAARLPKLADYFAYKGLCDWRDDIVAFLVHAKETLVLSRLLMHVGSSPEIPVTTLVMNMS